jgi:hypothetical protein
MQETVKRTSLIRLGGLAAMVGGVIFAVYGSLLDPEGTLVVPSVLALLGAMAVIVALHLLQRERYGRKGALASASAFVGVALILGSFIGFPSFAGEVLLAILGVVGIVVATIGIIALGIFTLEAGVLPR